MRIHGLTRTGLAAFAVVICTLLLSSSPALAGTGLGTSFSFSSPEGFSGPTGIGIDQSDGDVYVVERGSDALEKYSVSGSEAKLLWSKKPSETTSEYKYG